MPVVCDYEDEGHEAMEKLDMGQEEVVPPDDLKQQQRLPHQLNRLWPPWK
jgi:hypothetical protein